MNVEDRVMDAFAAAKVDATPSELLGEVAGEPVVAPEGDAASGEPAGDSAGAEAEPAAAATPEAPPEPEASGEPDEDESWQKRYKDLQSQKDRENARLQAQIEMLEQLAAGNVPVETEPAPPTINPDQDELATAVSMAPIDTFRQVLAGAPHLMPSVLHEIREQHGEAMYQQAQDAWTRAQIDANAMAMQQQIEAMQRPQQVQAELSSAIERVAQRRGDQFTELRADTAKLILENKHTLGNYASYDAYIDAQFLEAFQQRALSAPQVVETTPAPAFSEPGTPGQAAAPEVEDYSTQKQNALLGAYNRTRYSGA